MTRSGGGFGRRLLSDYGAEAAYLSKAVGRPVQVLWTREEDLAQDFYRPCGVHRLRAAVNSAGRVVAWDQRLANPSRYAYAKAKRPAVDSELYADDFPARCLPHVRLTYAPVESGIPGGAWRSTLHSSNAFAVQSFVDELAHAVGRDPLALRLELLGAPRQLEYKGHGGPVFDTGRLAAVLRLAAERAGWSRPASPSRARGIAGHFTFGSYAAHVVEVSRAPAGGVRVDRIVVAVDCGQVVNLSGAEAQVQGGVLDGLGAALHGDITVERGRVQQKNFDGYPLTAAARSAAGGGPLRALHRAALRPRRAAGPAGRAGAGQRGLRADRYPDPAPAAGRRARGVVEVAEIARVSRERNGAGRTATAFFCGGPACPVFAPDDCAANAYSPSLMRSTRLAWARALYTRRLTMLPGFCAAITFLRSAGDRTGVSSMPRMMSGPPLSGSTSSP